MEGEMDTFRVTTARVNASELLGYGYTISDIHWKTELCLPEVYESSCLRLRELWKKDRWNRPYRRYA